jgi:hypothetical protein
VAQSQAHANDVANMVILSIPAAIIGSERTAFRFSVFHKLPRSDSSQTKARNVSTLAHTLWPFDLVGNLVSHRLKTCRCHRLLLI